MLQSTTCRSAASLFGLLLGTLPLVGAQAPAAGAAQPIDLAGRLAKGTLRAVNREVTPLEGRPGAVHVSEKPGPGVIWIGGTDFAEGTIELDVRGRDVLQRSFLGVAFHRKDDTTYEAVYLRPFNFRSSDPARHQHAIQYISLPAFDWPRLRQEFPEEFENPVDPAIVPTDWVPLRVVVKGSAIQISVGPAKTPALEAPAQPTTAAAAASRAATNAMDRRREGRRTGLDIVGQS